jgi:hypothetical protein
MPLTRRLILQKARRHPSRLRRIVGERFQVLFHSPPGVLFTIPSRYSSAIGHQEVFSLTRWSWQIHSRFQGSAATRVPLKEIMRFHVPDFHRLRPDIPDCSVSTQFCNSFSACQHTTKGPTTPVMQPLTGITHNWFRLDPLSLATTHGITCCFLFLRVLRCFTSPRSLHTPYEFRCR